jgi:hypothetical protein
MKRVFLWLLVLPAFITSSMAQTVSSDEATNVALSFLKEHQPAHEAQSPEHAASIQDVYPFHSDEHVLYYIFNLSPDGWIAVSADIRVHPILAYSFKGTYHPEDEAPAFTAWMKQYQDQILYAIEKNNEVFPQTQILWDKYLNAQLPPLSGPLAHSPTGSLSMRNVEPLITSSWDQSPWYNAMCPADPLGPQGHCVAGCVPVCMAQVMYYFRWPETGTGSYTYTEPNYGVLSANFGETTYLWNEMTDDVSRSNDAVATLIYHLGVSCDLQYGPNGSGMYNHKAAFSLRTYFKYAPETQYLFRDSTSLNWDSVLIAHLDKKIPMYYAGWSDPNISGHAFVCDGYQDSCYFHFNFGWGGSSDGYFYTSDLTPGGYNFNLAQEVVINCYPDTINYTYPGQCSGDQILVSKDGSFEDGSGPTNPYLPTANCSWLIDPQQPGDSVSSITLNFKRFDTDASDFVTVYDGGTTNDPIMGEFSGDQLPPEITTDKNQLLVTFEATGATPANGFYATYEANQPVWCSGVTTIKADTAEFSDGSYDFDYYNNTLCKWMVETQSGEPLTLWFKSFDTEEGKDFLTIFDLETEDTLACISGYYPETNLPDSVYSTSGKVFIIFSTNSSVTAKGWEIYYPKKSNIGIPETNNIRDFKIFPNPTSGEAVATFTLTNEELLEVAILNTQGQPMQNMKIKGLQGKNSLNLHLNALEVGLYFIQIEGTHGIRHEKLIIQ